MPDILIDTINYALVYRVIVMNKNERCDFDESTWKEFERKYVHEIYDQVADHFSDTRYKPWPIVEKFLKELPFGSVGIDIGCGNGKYLSIGSKNIYIIGADYCERLTEHAQKRIQDINRDVFVGDHSNSSIKNESMDFVISIAVLHHFCTFERRLQAINEILRMLKINGKFLIFVWALEQHKNSRRVFHQQDTFVSWSIPTKKYSSNANADARIYQRYYHVFVKGELEKLLLSSDYEISINQSGYEKDNWFLEGYKHGYVKSSRHPIQIV